MPLSSAATVAACCFIAPLQTQRLELKKLQNTPSILISLPMAPSKEAALAAGAGLAAIFYGLKLLKTMKDKYDGLDSVVSYSSRKIAAARAMEAEEENALVRDPLAAALAGPKALRSARSRQQPAPADSGRKIKVNMMAVRTKWFDDQLEASLGMPLPIASAGGNSTYIAATAAAGQLPRQVVVVGAGMDSRAWRLKLPAGLRWFEVDRADVLQAKEELLSRSGAEIEVTSPVHRSQSINTLLEAKIGSIDHHTGGVQFPLRTDTRAAVAADLGDGAWLKELQAAGFDPGKPTVWLAEGVLMYLTPERAEGLLREMAGASAKGSALIAVSVTEEVIADIRARGSASELMSEWQFGCPTDPRGWLKGLGWEAKAVATRASIANALGLEPEVCAFGTDPEGPKNGRSLFIAAALA